MSEKTDRYYKGIRLETPVMIVFQKYINEKRTCESFLEKRKNKQASLDFIGRFYDKDSNKTIVEVVVEVRTLEVTKEAIENSKGYIPFPIEKLNELMMFGRLGKEIYIVYLLKDKVFFLKWSYYLKHNFELGKNTNGYFIKLPIKSFVFCGELSL